MVLAGMETCADPINGRAGRTGDRLVASTDVARQHDDFTGQR